MLSNNEEMRVKVNMFNEDENIKKNQWLLERQLSWINNCDIKIGAIVTLNLALLAGLAKYIGSMHTIWLDILYTLTALSIFIGLVLCKCGFKARLKAPNQSNIFFGTISSKEISSFSQEINTLSKEQFNGDLSAQIYTNAKIATNKYSYLSKATNILLITSVLWITTIGITVFTDKYTLSKKETIHVMNGK